MTTTASRARRHTAFFGRSWRSRDRRVAALIAAPAMLPFVVFLLVPIGYVVYLSFMNYDGVTKMTWAGLTNYRLALHDSAWWNSVKTTLELGVATMLIQIPLALGLALVLNTRPRFGSAFRAIYFVPHVISIAVMGVVFSFLLRPVDGAINGFLQALHLIGSDVDWLGEPTTAKLSIVLVGAWAEFGVNTVFFLVGLQTIPSELIESAKIDGATAWQRFRHVMFPMLSPVIRIVTLLSIAFTMRSFDIVKTLTDGGPAGRTDVMFTYIFRYYFSLTNGTQFGYASALAVIACVIIAAVAGLYLTASRQRPSKQVVD